MTDLSSSRLPPKGQALPHWDPLLRLAHWGIAVVVIANYAFTKEGGSVHIAFGWAGMALLLLRLIWGFVGPREARFAKLSAQSDGRAAPFGRFAAWQGTALPFAQPGRGDDGLCAVGLSCGSHADRAWDERVKPLCAGRS